MGKKENENKRVASVENGKVENILVNQEVSRETSLLQKMVNDIDSKYHPLIREVAGQTENFIEFSFKKKEKGKDEITVTRTSTDVALIANITTIEKLAELQDVSDIVICIAMGRVTKKDAESIGLKKPTDLLKAKFSNRWSDNTILKYYNVAKVFSLPSGSYEWRVGVPSDMSVSNLDALLTLCDGYKEAKTDADYEAVFNNFYNTYIRTNIISFAWTQKRIKDEIAVINGKKSGKIIDGKSKDVSNDSNTSDNSNNEANNQTTSNNEMNNQTNSCVVEDVDSKWKTALNSLTIIQTCFKGSDDSEVLQAIEKLSEKITEMLDKVTD